MPIDPGIATIVGSLIAGLAAIIAAIFSRNKQRENRLCRSRGVITIPNEGQEVSRVIYCEGKATIGSASTGHAFWLAVEKAGLVWPKETAIIPDGSGHWSATIREEGPPGTVAISLWCSTVEGAETIQAWFAKGRSNNDYPGLSKLPEARRIALVRGLRLIEDLTDSVTRAHY